VPGTGRLDAPLCGVGEEPGPNEVREGEPFVGKSGKEVTVSVGSLGRDGCFLTNVRKCRGLGEESEALRLASIQHCVAAYLQPEFAALTACRTVLAIGADALEVIVGPRSAIKWHGAVLTREEADAIREAHAT
jgi:DNA polymerase